MTTKRSRGRPKGAISGDAQSILDKIEFEVEKFDVKLANELGQLLDAYYQLAFTAEKENTKKAVLEKLIERAQSKIDKRDDVSGKQEDLSPQKETPSKQESISLIAVDFTPKKAVGDED